eukprot:TRINITY_DN40387_c0_g1_i1.p1 TRINITY_DN40387_c0_g1~~TRINITY_DN40387_c0_g1_i1.p1  ORF type:complete len:107 (+),score=25.21 TRINITY_DN40387_c0_g1_i1:116-436(+)
MGNCEVCLATDHPLTTERMEVAVRQMDAEELKRLLDSGVCVNSPIDSEGHTVLDLLLAEHQRLLSNTKGSQLSSATKSKEYYLGTSDQVNQIFEILREHGAEFGVK